MSEKQPAIHPNKIARAILRETKLLRNLETFYKWTGPHWQSLTNDEAYQLAFRAVELEDPDHEPSSTRANEVLACLRGRVQLPDELRGEPGLLSVANGLLDLETGQLREHSPDVLNASSLPYSYDPDAGDPEQWLRFLEDIWPGRAEFVETLQMWMGYNLVPDTRQQKFLHLVGPPRSGKGTIANMIEHMVGKENTTRPALSDIGSEFGLEDAVDKLAMIISEGNANRNSHMILDKILQIVGEDGLNVNRKFRPVWRGKLDTRITILSNEPLRLKEGSGALVARLIVLPTFKDNTGTEDLNLGERLRSERAAVLKWAIVGWRKLQDSGRLIQPAGAEDYIDAQRATLDPVGEFLDECCLIDSSYDVTKRELFHAYTDWCRQSGERPMANSQFGTKLQARSIRAAKPRRGGNRVPVYVGVKLRDDWCDGPDELLG